MGEVQHQDKETLLETLQAYRVSLYTHELALLEEAPTVEAFLTAFAQLPEEPTRRGERYCRLILGWWLVAPVHMPEALSGPVWYWLSCHISVDGYLFGIEKLEQHMASAVALFSPSARAQWAREVLHYALYSLHTHPDAYPQERLQEHFPQLLTMLSEAVKAVAKGEAAPAPVLFLESLPDEPISPTTALYQLYRVGLLEPVASSWLVGWLCESLKDTSLRGGQKARLKVLSWLPMDALLEVFESSGVVVWETASFHTGLTWVTYIISKYCEGAFEGSGQLPRMSSFLTPETIAEEPLWYQQAWAHYPQAEGVARTGLRRFLFSPPGVDTTLSHGLTLFPLLAYGDNILRDDIFALLCHAPFEESREALGAVYDDAPLLGKQICLQLFSYWQVLQCVEEARNGERSVPADWDGEAAFAFFVKEHVDAREAEVSEEERGLVEATWARLAVTPETIASEYQAWMEGPLASPVRERDRVMAQEMYRLGFEIRDSERTLLRFEPLTVIECLMRVKGRRASAELDKARALFGPYVLAAGESFLAHEPVDACLDLYELLVKEHQLPVSLHQRFLLETSGKFQRLVSQSIAKAEGALSALLPLLKEKKAGDRLSVIRALQLIGAEEALAPLKQQLEVERAKKCKEALQEAIEACQPGQKEKTFALGIYRRGRAFLEQDEAMVELRELLYVPADEVTWARAVDIINRLPGEAAQAVAADYLSGHGLSHWPDPLRVIPWSWGDSSLASLGHHEPGLHWMPLSAFFQGKAEAFLDHVLGEIESARQKRRLPREEIDTFLDWIEVGWHWCDTNDIPLTWFEARLDGGAYKGAGQPPSTCLTLRSLFGLSLERGKAFGGHTGPAGIRWIRIMLPREHSFRELYPTRGNGRYMDLRDILSLEEAQAQLFGS